MGDSLLAHGIEREWEDAAREHTCPSCHQPRKKPCVEDGKKMAFAHTRRYLKAARKGKVPALPGGDYG